MIRTTLDDLPDLEELFDAALRGEEVIITGTHDDETRAVRIVVADGKEIRPRAPGSARGLIWMSDDFDAPLEEFEEYMR
jgi:antitoxin (DNA-binding transcriptional repressor) of toxin-antitoxin stability system